MVITGYAGHAVLVAGIADFGYTVVIGGLFDVVTAVGPWPRDRAVHQIVQAEGVLEMDLQAVDWIGGVEVVVLDIIVAKRRW